MSVLYDFVCWICVGVALSGPYWGGVAFGVFCYVFGFGILMAAILWCRGKR